ncbi:DUF2325 domain-containing protein [Thioflavicoccus mobilis]|nr:DUF2325 domain-containing protein [Thioflavicoccus mobilis]
MPFKHPALARGLPDAPLPALPTTAQTGTARKKSALKLWDVDHKYHCPIVGTCLHVDELRRLLEKVEDQRLRQLSDYQVHVAFVGAADTKNALSLATQKLLDRRFATSIRRFARAKTAREVTRLWHEAVAAGEVSGPFWALMSHPKADTETRALAYEEVHMLSHQIGAGLRAEAKALAEARARAERIECERRSEARRYEQRLAERDRQLAALREALARSEEEGRRQRTAISATPTEEDAHRIAAVEAELAAARQAHEATAEEARRLRRRQRSSEDEIARLTAALGEQQAAAAALERLLPGDTADDCPAGCPAGRDCKDCVDLRGRRILCIGGRGTLAEHYRDLVARCNGELVRHDGGLEDSHHRLESMMAAADAIVCPADFVSHNAYQRAKRFCKRYAKPCILMRSSGIASFARALEQLAA